MFFFNFAAYNVLFGKMGSALLDAHMEESDVLNHSIHIHKILHFLLMNWEIPSVNIFHKQIKE